VASCLRREGHLRGEESEKKSQKAREKGKENVSSLYVFSVSALKEEEDFG
jgi:hypothetical protein